MSRLIKIVLTVITFITLNTHSFAELSQKHFPVDDYLRPRVDFWKRIFGEIYSYEGLLHDEQDLKIVYKKIEFQDLSRKQKIRFVKDEKRSLENILNSIAKKKKENLTEEENTLIQKIGDPGLDEIKRLAKGIRFHQGMRDRYVQGLERSYLYQDKIIEIFSELGLPTELGYLPHVESSFNYLAYSKVGAAGIWQFMRSTGKIYKLKLDYIIDERRDPIKATYAAAKLLRDNYAKLNSWPLALTAYNHGARSMENAVRKIGTTDISKIIQNYDGRRFGFASKNFYPSFVAAAEIAQDPDRYFGKIEKRKMPSYSEMPLERSLSARQIMGALNIDRTTFEEFNLSIRPPAFKSDLYLPKGFVIKVPQADEETLAKYKLALSGVKSRPSQLVASGAHTVSQGESLYQIAQIYKTNVTDLIALNKLSSPSKIYPGLNLEIPGANFKAAEIKKDIVPAEIKVSPVQPSPKLLDVKVTLSDESKKALDIMKADAPVPAVAEIKTAEVAEGPSTWQKIKGFFGDTFTKAPDTTEEQAQEGLNETVALNETAEKKINNEDIFKDYNLEVVKINDKTHQVIVEAEETLGHYSDWLVVRAQVIRSLNGIRGNNIRVGQKIKLPMTEEEAIKFNIKRVEYHLLIEEDFYNNFKVTGTTEYKVRPGDTLSSISQKFEVPVWLLQKTWKSMDLGIKDLKVGTLISLPQVSAKNEAGGAGAPTATGS
ncbi:MAG: LysM peptidoglycan-binding domain-containing protein [Bacteriovoracaceae bacterium]|nr:LysM peptidoglycan-binding domain-containing protein [Bacteriovoracaceae bacterium]